MDVMTMSRVQWEKIFDRWYRHVFNVGVFGTGGPSEEVIEQCYGLGVSPAEAVHWLKRQEMEQCCEG
jgi:hypothetical protein